MARFAILAVFMPILCACATEPAAMPDPVLVTKDVGRIVQTKCEDRRPPAPDYPDDPDELLAVPLDDATAVFALAQKYVAARMLYRQRLAEDEAQIKACAGE